MRTIIFSACIAVLSLVPVLSICSDSYPYDNDYTGESAASDPSDTGKEIILPPGLTDLEKNPHSFILELRRIEIDGHPGSFNPSILRWNDSLLLSFRIRDQKNVSTHQMGLVFLDEDFNPASKVYIIQMRLPPRQLPTKDQDPRLICLQDRLLIVYSNTLDEPNEKETRRVCISEVKWDGDSFFVDAIEWIEKYPGMTKLRWEKNWTPFIYEDELHLVYSLVPHHIFKPVWGTNSCVSACSSIGLVQWKWGVLRGGSQAFVVDGEYLSFFHSSINMASVQSLGKVIQHYFMGAYTFSAKPPFAITRMSKEPIIGKKFYNGVAYKTWKPLLVVFPGGFIFNEKFIWVVYGRQDHELWVAKLDKKGLFDSLVPITSMK
ncbi:MAG: hypothetical protein AB7O89_04400 [Parachlamydiales bacterium]